MIEEAPGIPVTDLFGVANDPSMPFLIQALNPLAAHRHFERHLPFWTPGDTRFQLTAIRVVRHKPGRRCLIEYDIEATTRAGQSETQTLIGKTRAKGADSAAPRLLSSLREAGFGDDSEDAILVPEPIGVIPEFRMWLQRKAPGVAATRLLTGTGGTRLAERIATAARKLHTAMIPSTRRHTMADELRILHERLARVAQSEPEWANRIEQILNASDRLGAATPEPSPVGIHRDFYADQALVNGERLYLLDFDLYCMGDCGVDIGNFVGHITEYAIRTSGNPAAFADQEHALVERFIELTGENARQSIRAYTILTLARHIYLSAQFPERGHTTLPLVELCEERLGITAHRATFGG